MQQRATKLSPFKRIQRNQAESQYQQNLLLISQDPESSQKSALVNTKTEILRQSIERVRARAALVQSPKRYDKVNSKVRTNLHSQQKLRSAKSAESKKDKNLTFRKESQLKEIKAKEKVQIKRTISTRSVSVSLQPSPNKQLSLAKLLTAPSSSISFQIAERQAEIVKKEQEIATLKQELVKDKER